MRVVIVGGGAVGEELTRQLLQHREEVALVEVDATRAEALAGELDAMILHGDATDPDVLREARLHEADALVAVTGSDPNNLVAAILGKRFEVGRIVVRLEGLGLRPACEELGVDEIVSSKKSAAGHVLASLRGAHHVDFSVMARGGIDIVELETGQVTGSAVRDLSLPNGAMVAAIRRSSEEVLLAEPDVKLRDHDTLLVMVERKRTSFERVRHALGIEQDVEEASG